MTTSRLIPLDQASTAPPAPPGCRPAHGGLLAVLLAILILSLTGLAADRAAAASLPYGMSPGLSMIGSLPETEAPSEQEKALAAALAAGFVLDAEDVPSDSRCLSDASTALNFDAGGSRLRAAARDHLGRRDPSLPERPPRTLA